MPPVSTLKLSRVDTGASSSSAKHSSSCCRGFTGVPVCEALLPLLADVAAATASLPGQTESGVSGTEVGAVPLDFGPCHEALVATVLEILRASGVAVARITRNIGASRSLENSQLMSRLLCQ